MRDLFALTSVGALIIALATVGASRFLAFHVSVFLIGYIVWRKMGARLVGLVPCLIGADFLLYIMYDWVYLGRDNGLFGFRPLHIIAATTIVVVGILGFLLPVVSLGRNGTTQVRFAICFICFLILWHVFVPMYGESSAARRRADETRRNIAARQNAVAHIYKLQTEIGQIPTKTDLLHYSKKPLPSLTINGIEIPIHYERIHDHFVLWHVNALSGHYHYYGSRHPVNGWQVSF